MNERVEGESHRYDEQISKKADMRWFLDGGWKGYKSFQRD